MTNFYSDTQTREMRESILDIPLGDERHDEDPCTVQFDAPSLLPLITQVTL
jgi:hypothetical protein